MYSTDLQGFGWVPPLSVELFPLSATPTTSSYPPVLVTYSSAHTLVEACCAGARRTRHPVRCTPLTRRDRPEEPLYRAASWCSFRVRRRRASAQASGKVGAGLNSGRAQAS